MFTRPLTAICVIFVVCCAQQTTNNITITVRTSPQYRLVAFPVELDRAVSGNLVNHGVHSPQHLALAKELLQGGKKDKCLVIDVGAHVGTFSLYVASLGYRVISIEPMPSSAKKLAAGIALNSLDTRVDLHKVAVTDPVHARAQTTCMRSEPANIAKSFVGRADAKSSNQACKSVAVSTLDTVVSGSLFGHSRICLMRVSVQGMEFRTLLGAKKLLRHAPCNMLINYCPALLEGSGSDPLAFLHYLHTDLDYDIFLEQDKIGPYSPQAFHLVVEEVRKLGEVNLYLRHRKHDQCISDANKFHPKARTSTSSAANSKPPVASTAADQSSGRATTARTRHVYNPPSTAQAVQLGPTPLYMAVSIPPIPSITPPPIVQRHARRLGKSNVHVWVLAAGTCASLLFVVRGLIVKLD